MAVTHELSMAPLAPQSGQRPLTVQGSRPKKLTSLKNPLKSKTKLSPAPFSVFLGSMTEFKAS